MAELSWKEKLSGQVPAGLGQEIDFFDAQVALRKAGKIDEKVFAETRLRRGAYGQRYDNGQRHDGLRTQKLAYGSLTKGPDTYWDAPGMERIKIPYGGLNAEQLRVLADLAEEYSDFICHITTRQDVQLHFVQIDDCPDLFRRLAAVGITTREACGNSVRNVTACPLAGVCRTEAFDVTPYAKAVAVYLLGHRDTQDFGRKFKIAFSGCEHEACALVSIHDMGGIAKVVDGRRGFALYVAGGLGAVPHQAKLFQEFVAEEDLLPMSRAICRVFARLGEKKARNKARLKFLVQKLGIDEFRRLVLEDYRTMPDDAAAWRPLFDEIPRWEDKPAWTGVQLNGVRRPEGFDAWAATNVYEQRQGGYVVATVTCPLGDLSSDQTRALADVAERYAGGNVRLTVEQNVVLRWVPHNKVVDLYTDLKALGLAQPGAGSIVDVTSCPGTDTCKLGIASSRGLAGVLRERLGAKSASLDAAVRGLRIKVSGCFNSCGQHHVADIGFYGNSRNVGNYTVPHFQVMLGGKWRENGGSYALAMGAVPSKRIPELVTALTDRFVAERQGPDDTFQAWCGRIGKKQLKTIVDPFAPVPAHKDNASFYNRLGRPPRIHHRRPGHRRVRRRGRHPATVRAEPSGSRGVRGPTAARRRPVPGGRRAGLPGHAHGGQDAGAGRSPGRVRCPRRDRRRVPRPPGRAQAVLGHVRGRPVQPVLLPAARRARPAVHPRHGPQAGRGGEPVHRRRLQVRPETAAAERAGRAGGGRAGGADGVGRTAGRRRRRRDDARAGVTRHF